jgi:NADH dehydrogenase
MQMGRFAARMIDRETRSGGGPDPARRPSFVYTDKGMLATIGRAKAVGLIGRVKLRGYFAWWAWLLIHILFLIGFRSRILVMIQWAWAYWTFDRGARLITRDAETSREGPG